MVELYLEVLEGEVRNMSTGRIDSVNVVLPDETVSSQLVSIDFTKLGQVRGYKKRAKTVGIVVHHTAGSGVDTAIRTLNQRGGLGYHYIVSFNGTIYNLVDPDYIAYHGSEANSNTVSVSLEGVATGTEKAVLAAGQPPVQRNNYTEVQIRNAASLVKALMNRYGLTKDKVLGHGEVEPFLIQKQIAAGKSVNVDPSAGVRGRGKLAAEGLRVVQYIRGSGTGPSQATLDEIWNTRGTAGTGAALGGGSTSSPNLPTITTDSYFKDTYTVPISGSGFGLVNDRIAIKEVKAGYDSLTVSVSTPTPIQDVVRNTALYAESQLEGELTLLRGVAEINAQFVAEAQSTLSKIDGLLPAEAAFLVQYDLFEFNPDLMRKQMTVNAGESNTAQSGDNQHAWRLPGKLAVTTTLLLPGVSGIRFGQVFRVGRTYEIFKKFGVFQTLGLTETISVNRGWTTEVYGRLIGIPSSKLIEKTISG